LEVQSHISQSSFELLQAWWIAMPQKHFTWHSRCTIFLCLLQKHSCLFLATENTDTFSTLILCIIWSPGPVVACNWWCLAVGAGGTHVLE
jgi:hypothetical protein